MVCFYFLLVDTIKSYKTTANAFISISPITLIAAMSKELQDL